jgi:4-amino-4-deoxy-L-arabinose transferase
VTALPFARLLLVLVPVACVGLFGRAYYTPDEPREASLVVAMASQPNKAVPQLAGRPFAEKPPLLYWLGGAAVAEFGASPAAARLPNLAYLLVTAFAIAWLAARAAGARAGFAAGLVAVTALQLYQVLTWLATDAPLVMGVAVALLGTFQGLTARDRRGRLSGYLVLHLGLAIAFFAKGFAGWMVPVLAFMTVIVAERRWRELLCIELWAGVPLLVLAIATWVWFVARLPGGHDWLKVLFWYNLVGRAVPVEAPLEFAYAAGHRNFPGKYLLELPLYLLPWTPLAFAALRRAPRGWRLPGAEGTAWRLALGAIVPATLLLSLAATARGVYYGPPALGFAILIGLYVGSAGTALDRHDRRAWRLTGWLIALMALTLAAVAALAGFAPAGREPVGMALAVLALLSGGSAAWLALRLPVAAAGALPRQALAMGLVLTCVTGPLLRQLNEWQSLEAVAGRIVAAAGHRPLVVLGADETTIAMADLYIRPTEVLAVLGSGERDATQRAVAALAASDGTARIVWLIRDAARWDLGAWLGFLGYGHAPPPPVAMVPDGVGPLTVECVVVRPGGRAYAVLAAATAAPVPAAVCR